MRDPLFDGLARALDEDGICIWRGLIDPQAIDVHLEAYEMEAPAIDLHFRADKTPASLPAHREARRGFYEADHTHESLCFEPRLINFLRHRFADEPVLRMVGTHLYNVGSHIHADCLNTLATDPWEHELRIWGALQDIDPASGPIYLYPKSHRLISSTIREEMLAEQPWYRDWLMYDSQPYTEKAKAFGRHMQEKIEAGILRHGISQVTPILKKGDALIFNPATVHGTAEATNSNLTRKCIIFNFYARETPFYAPGAYWGATHDHRRKENEISFDVETTGKGLRVINYLRTCQGIREKQIICN